MSIPKPAEGDTDAPQEKTPKRDYDIYARVALADPADDTQGIYLKFLATWTASSHEAALRGWGNDHPDSAKIHTHGYVVVTATSSKVLGGGVETTFVVRPR